mmetsp:Transcript_22188/g.79081  ORF Transcript_22188/g.79081 Transcript_22188/m.79081 type:complete len:278 (+) Transcript_22188:688-1521(+)
MRRTCASSMCLPSTHSHLRKCAARRKRVLLGFMIISAHRRGGLRSFASTGMASPSPWPSGVHWTTQSNASSVFGSASRTEMPGSKSAARRCARPSVRLNTATAAPRFRSSKAMARAAPPAPSSRKRARGSASAPRLLCSTRPWTKPLPSKLAPIKTPSRHRTALTAPIACASSVSASQSKTAVSLCGLVTTNPPKLRTRLSDCSAGPSASGVTSSGTRTTSWVPSSRSTCGKMSGVRVTSTGHPTIAKTRADGAIDLTNVRPLRSCPTIVPHALSRT